MEYRWTVRNNHSAPIQIQDLNGFWIKAGLGLHGERLPGTDIELHKIFPLEVVQNSYGLRELLRQGYLEEVEKFIPTEASIEIYDLKNKINELSDIIKNMSVAPQPPPQQVIQQSVDNDILLKLMSKIDSLSTSNPNIKKEESNTSLDLNDLALKALSQREVNKESTFTDLGETETIESSTADLVSKLPSILSDDDV